jgi:hypothetical protein
VHKIGLNSEPFWQFSWEQVTIVSSVVVILFEAVDIWEEHRPQSVGPKKAYLTSY